MDFIKIMELAEASRRDVMGYEDPYEKTAVQKSPKEGDMIISAPATFFRGPASRALYKKGVSGQKMAPNPKINPWFISSKQKMGIQGDPESEQNGLVGKPYYDAVYVFNPSMKKKFSVDDILHDVTNAYGPHERYGRNVWLYIPANNTQLKMAYDKFANKLSQQPDSIDHAKAADEAEAAERTKSLDTKVNFLGMDAKDVVNKQADQDKLAFYKKLNSQATTMLKMQEDPTLLLKRAFADDERAKDPQFIDYLKRKGATTLADYLSGRDIKKLFSGPEDDLNQRVAAKKAQLAPKVNHDDQWNNLFAKKKEPEADLDDKWQAAFRKAQSTERDPLAAMKTPMPLTKAESVKFKGKRLLGEATRHYPYY